jgi:hypothetical protein
MYNPVFEWGRTFVFFNSTVKIRTPLALNLLYHYFRTDQRPENSADDWFELILRFNGSLFDNSGPSNYDSDTFVSFEDLDSNVPIK